MSVQEYVDKHMLQQKVEQAVNACVKDRPDEPLSYLGNFMIDKAPAEIIKVVGRQILDSRGNPTVEASVTTYQGSFTGAVPSGASTGSHEAHELRDGDKSVYLGKGVLKAVENINSQIAPTLKGQDPTKQKEIDDLLKQIDGTDDKKNLGANAILAVSIAVARAGAAVKKLPLYQHLAELAGNKNYTTLPVPAFNIINGGKHAGNPLAFQEFMILPIGAKTFSEALQIGAEVYHSLKGILKSEFGIDATNVGDEGGFAPPVTGAEHSLKLIEEAIAKAGHKGKVFVGLDCAASEFYNESDKTYDLNFKAEKNDGSGKKTGEELLQNYKKLVADYPIVSIEDPFFEDDWDSFQGIVKENLGLIIGDDLLVTNPKLIKKAIETKAASGLLLKVNQIGTVTESIDAVKLAKGAGWAVMTSHRSGETEDTFIADLSVGLATGLIKSGAPCRSERNAKYNQLLRIESELQERANYTGDNYKFISIEGAKE